MVALAAGVLGFAGPAAAGGGDSVRIDHERNLTIRSAEPMQVTAMARATCPVGVADRAVSLTLTGPAGAHSAKQTLATEQAPCNGDDRLDATLGAPDRNGTYVVTLHNEGSVSAPATARLTVLIPPAQPKDLVGSADGTVASFHWAANPEPDIVSYQIVTSAGTLVTSARAAASCGRSKCSTSTDLGPNAARTTEQFAVRALRCARSCADHITGASSAPAAVTFGAASSPTTTPAPTPTSGGTGTGTGGSSGASSAGGGYTGGESTDPGGVTTPPPTPRSYPSEVKPLHKPTHPMAALTGTTVNSAADAETKPAGIGHDLSDGFNGAPVWRSVAGTAVVLLLASHLAAWATRLRRS
jgi:hypothetical protein